MLILSLGFVTFATFSSVFASPSLPRSRYGVKETHRVPQGWERVGPAPRDAHINLRIALKQSNFDYLEQQLLEVSDPRSKKYGQHLSAAQVNDLVKPSAKTYDLVHMWLAEHGHSGTDLSYSPAKDWVKLSVPVTRAEVLLDTKYSLFRHHDGTEAVRAPQFSLPVHLHRHIDAVQPTTSFFRFKPQAVRWLESPQVAYDTTTLDTQRAVQATDLSVDDISAACNASNVTPDCLRTLYGTKDYVPKVPEKSKVGYCNYLEETTISTDLATFVAKYRQDAQNASIDIRVVNNGQNQQVLDSAKKSASSDVEGNLDGETITGIAYPIPVIAYNTGGRPMTTAPYKPAAGKQVENEPYLDWLEYMQGLPDSEVPPTISTSYGEDEQSVPPEYAQRVCQSFAQLGSRGVTLLFSSGDAGVGTNAPGSDKCEVFPNPEVAQDALPNFMPNFPASCPYVTTVGATKGQGAGSFNTEVAAGYPENAGSGYASGGGFSNYFSRPAWQEDTVQAYMKILTPEEVDPKMYNHSGRAYPDLAANGQSYSVVWNKRFISVDGTSASSPTMGAVIALLNDALIAGGKPPLGFMNPWLYSTGKAGFTDIISGSAKGCGVAGFPAKEGWDAVTGFGTPNFVALQKLAVGQQATAPGPPGDGYIDPGYRSGGGGGHGGGGGGGGRGGGWGWSWGNTWF